MTLMPGTLRTWPGISQMASALACRLLDLEVGSVAPELARVA